MAVKSRQFAISTTPTKVAKGSSAQDKFGVILAEASANVWVGGDDVTVANGLLLQPGAQLTLDLSADDNLWVVTDAGSPTVKVLTTRAGLVEP